MDLVTAFETEIEFDYQKEDDTPLGIVIGIWNKHFPEITGTEHFSYPTCPLGKDLGDIVLMTDKYEEWICLHLRKDINEVEDALFASHIIDININNEGYYDVMTWGNNSEEKIHSSGLDSYQAIYAGVKWLGVYAAAGSIESQEKLKAFITDLESAFKAQPRLSQQPSAPAPAAA